MQDFSRREAVGVVVILGLVTTLVGTVALRNGSAATAPAIVLKEAATSTPVAPPAQASRTPARAEPSTEEVVVHVTGAVKKPGVYHLPETARGEDAIKAAGGSNADANPDALNLAARLEDGARLHVPTRKEVPEVGAEFISSLLKTERPASPSAPTSAKSASASSAAPPKPEKLTTPGQGTVHLNTANAEELQRLPGIGPATAERILEFRKANGGFKTIEDLLEVSGIGEKKFAKMKPFVRTDSESGASRKRK